MDYTNVSYREPLCEYDNKGITFFSPLCNENILKQFRHQYETNVIDNDNVDTTKKADTKSYSQGTQDSQCYVPPVHMPTPQVKQFTDKQSAYDWFKDPTYSQRVSAKKRHIDESQLEHNESLLLYHKLKLAEKVAGSLMQTL